MLPSAGADLIFWTCVTAAEAIPSSGSDFRHMPCDEETPTTACVDELLNGRAHRQLAWNPLITATVGSTA